MNTLYSESSKLTQLTAITTCVIAVGELKSHTEYVSIVMSGCAFCFYLGVSFFALNVVVVVIVVFFVLLVPLLRCVVSCCVVLCCVVL
jgi:hypothetical protein